MKVATIDGSVLKSEGLKIQKPVQKIFVKEILKPGHSIDPETYDDYMLGKGTMASLRVRLISSASGSNKEILSETRMSIVSEISSKKEGFQRRMGLGNNGKLSGYNNFIFSLNDEAAVALDNDKYLQVDLLDLSPLCIYEVYGFEFPVISPFCVSYVKQFLAPTELEKSFSVGSAEYLALPIDMVKEIQFFPKTGDSSPVYLPEEIMLNEEMQNDLTSVAIGGEGICNALTSVGSDTHIGRSILPINFGFSNWTMIDLSLYKSFNLKRLDNANAMMFFLIDSKA